MRHRKTVKKLGRTASHRKALLRNLASALIEHKQIRTTFTKAKAAQGYVEKLIGYGKSDSVHSRRLAFKLLQNRSLVKTLFDEIAPTFDTRNGGYTRVIKLGQRRGDSAQLAILQLVGFERLIIDEQPAKPKRKKKKSSKAGAAAAAAATVAEAADAVEEAVEDAADTAADVAEDVKDAATDAVEEAKDAAEEVVEEAKEAAKEVAEEVAETAEEVKEEAEKAAKDAAGEDKKEEDKDDEKDKK